MTKSINGKPRICAHRRSARRFSLSAQVTTICDKEASWIVAFFMPGATTPFDQGVLKASGAPKFDNNTQNTEIFTFAIPHPLSDFGNIVLTMNNSGNDEWHIFGINLVVDSPSGPQTCLYDDQGQPLQVVKSDARSMTLTPSSGCP